MSLDGGAATATGCPRKENHMQAYYAVGDRHCPACGCVVSDLPGIGGIFHCPACENRLLMTCIATDHYVSFTLTPVEG